MYALLRELAGAGAAILFYSTDYDELIGCCDRVLVMYDGAIRRELVGAEITEHALVSSALNIGTDGVLATTDTVVPAKAGTQRRNVTGFPPS
jgi:ribose transport system ATP-binding protein